MFDALLRPGSEFNLAWLGKRRHPRLEFVHGDVRDASARRAAAASSHLSLGRPGRRHHLGRDPRTDFEINALGTFNVLEAARRAADSRRLYASTNKVYGGMEDVAVIERPTRYEYRESSARHPRDQPLDFHSPYGCSKGAGDQYVRDYARIYGLRTVVFRMSCIYGPRQFGNEDQGWLAHFLIAARTGKPITIYGDGKQVRDVLFVEDLVGAFRLAVENRRTAGQVYNIGGGPANTLAVWPEFGSCWPTSIRQKVDGAPRRLAPGRPALLCQRHPQGGPHSGGRRRSTGRPASAGSGIGSRQQACSTLGAPRGRDAQGDRINVLVTGGPVSSVPIWRSGWSPMVTGSPSWTTRPPAGVRTSRVARYLRATWPGRKTSSRPSPPGWTRCSTSPAKCR